MRLTRNFSLEQLIDSETAERERIDNTPGPEIVDNLRLLAQGLERVQLLTEFPLEISSGNSVSSCTLSRPWASSRRLSTISGPGVLSMRSRSAVSESISCSSEKFRVSRMRQF